jgi:catechol 2,3-dioxygenase-like lactoylglutathione lyase family enzyme
MTMIKRLAHACILSTDLAKTEAFYCKALGMERYFDFEKDGELFGFYLKAGDQTYIEVFKGQPGEAGNINHLALEVDDMDGVVERMRANGVEVTEKKLGADQSWQAWLQDPSGVRIELHQYTSASSQYTRRTVKVDW